MRIIIFGDSIAEGFWDYENGGWVNRLKIDFWKKYGYGKMIFNAGVSAYTSQNIINYFDDFFNAVSRREVGKEKETVVIFTIGINDSAEDMILKEKRVDISKFKENIETLICKCEDEKLIQRVIFLSATNVEESIINDVNNLGAEHFFYNSEIEKYNAVIEKCAQNHSCEYINVFGLMQEGDLEDGLHPSSTGHEKIYQKVLEYLEK